MVQGIDLVPQIVGTNQDILQNRGIDQAIQIQDLNLGIRQNQGTNQAIHQTQDINLGIYQKQDTSRDIRLQNRVDPMNLGLSMDLRVNLVIQVIEKKVDQVSSNFQCGNFLNTYK